MADWIHAKHAGEGSERSREHPKHDTAPAHHEDATAGHKGNHGRNTLHAGQSIGSGENPNYLVGTSGAQLVVQADGDLVLYRGDKHSKDEVVWSSGTAHKGHGASSSRGSAWAAGEASAGSGEAPGRLAIVCASSQVREFDTHNTNLDSTRGPAQAPTTSSCDRTTSSC